MTEVQTEEQTEVQTEVKTVSCTFSGTEKTMSFETGRLAGLADGAVLAKIGRSPVLVTAPGSRSTACSAV